MRKMILSLFLGVVLFVAISTSVAAPTQNADSQSISTPATTSPVERFLDIFYKVVVCLVGIIGAITCLGVGIKYFKEWRHTIAGFDNFIKTVQPDLRHYKRMAKRTNCFMEKVLPDILRGLLKNKTVQEETVRKLIGIIAADHFDETSRKTLNDTGMDLLKNSKMLTLIDTNLDTLLAKLGKRDLKSLLDVERQSYYLLRDNISSTVLVHFENYLFNNPEKTLEDILFTGSLYLCEKYLAKIPKLTEVEIKEDELSFEF